MHREFPEEITRDEFRPFRRVNQERKREFHVRPWLWQGPCIELRGLAAPSGRRSFTFPCHFGYPFAVEKRIAARLIHLSNE
jgi:hypothetical protein